MTPIGAISWIWTIVTLVGVLYAVGELRECLLDNWAVSQVSPRPSDYALVKEETRATVISHAFIVGALAALCGAGVAALVGFQIVALSLLILNAGLLVGLSMVLTYFRRRRRHWEVK